MTDASTLPAGTPVRTRSGVWTAYEAPDEFRWRHESHSRRASDYLVNAWLESGQAQLITGDEQT